MFDSREHEWNDISVVLVGKNDFKTITSLRGVKYKVKQDKDFLFVNGNKPQSIQRGNKSYEGEITLLQNEYQKLREAAGGDILDLQFDLIVQYGNPSEGTKMISDTLLRCEITEDEIGWKQGDKFTEKSLPFIFLDLSTDFI